MSRVPLFHPAWVAVVGTRARSRSFGGQVLDNLVRMGIPGTLYATHPRQQEFRGQPCYGSLRELPERRDRGRRILQRPTTPSAHRGGGMNPHKA